ncbi:MAG: hypothetical protein ACTHJW_25820 [Streptosporangiaceae bacterium]
METQRKLRSVVKRVRGTTSWTQLARKLVVPALALVSLGATAAASPATGAHHQTAGRAAHQAAASLCAHTKMPWMYSPTNHLPWMYSPTNHLPWMYASRGGEATTLRSACAPTRPRV